MEIEPAPFVAFTIISAWAAASAGIESPTPGMRFLEAAKLLEGCERHYLEPLSSGERRQLLELFERLVARDLANNASR